MPIFRRLAQGNVEAIPYRGDRSNFPGWAHDFDPPESGKHKVEVGDWLVFEDGKIKTVKGVDFPSQYELVSSFSG